MMLWFLRFIYSVKIYEDNFMKKHSRDNAPQNFMNFLYKIFNILYPQPQGEKKKDWLS